MVQRGGPGVPPRARPRVPVSVVHGLVQQVLRVARVRGRRRQVGSHVAAERLAVKYF